MEKHKLALTVQNRVISLKFSTHRVSKKCTLGNFQKIFLFPKMAAILNFRIFAKNRKTGICFCLLNKRLIGWTLHMIMCVLLCYPVSIHMSQLQATGRPISSLLLSKIHTTALVRLHTVQQNTYHSTCKVIYCSAKHIPQSL